MLVELARRLCRPCYVIHNETKVYEFKPDGWDEERHKDNSSAIVYNVWGEHAFFYQTEAGPWAARLRVKTVTEVPTHRLAVLADDVPEVTWEEMRHFGDIRDVQAYYTWAEARQVRRRRALGGPRTRRRRGARGEL
jgi:hypothetical protein